MSTELTRSFLQSYDYVRNAAQEPRRARAFEEEQSRQRQRQDESDAMGRQEHEMNMGLKQIQLQALERERARQVSEEDKQVGAYRLLAERVQLDALGEDLEDGEIDIDWPSYLDSVNYQERDKVDPMGDGRYIADINELPDGRFTFEVAGGKIEGRKPITRNRKTAAEGDHEVTAVPPQAIMHDHLGRTQGFLEKYPEFQEIIGDPAKARQWLKTAKLRNRMETIAASGQDPSAVDPATAREQMKASNALSLESQRHAHDLELERLKQTGQSAGSSSQVQTLNWLQENLGASPEEAWQMIEDQKRNPSAFIEKYIAAKVGADFSGTTDQAALVEEAVAVQQQIQQSLGKRGASQALTAQPEQPTQQAQDFSEFPDPVSLKGREIVDEETGERYRSDGSTWMPVK